MVDYLWTKYAEFVITRWQRHFLFDVMLNPYRRPKTFTPLVTIYSCGFYTGIIAAAITEQLYKEKYWEEHPGHEVPLMQPKFYWGPWKVYRGEILRYEPPQE